MHTNLQIHYSSILYKTIVVVVLNLLSVPLKSPDGCWLEGPANSSEVSVLPSDCTTAICVVEINTYSSGKLTGQQDTASAHNLNTLQPISKDLVSPPCMLANGTGCW